jgi:hypothetical protein
MKVVFSRGQRAEKGLLGGNKGVTFTVSCRLQLSQAENALVEKYWPADTMMGSQDDSIALGVRIGTTKPGVRLADLTQGCSAEGKSVGTMQEVESLIVTVCRSFSNYITAAAEYQGEQAVEV